MGGECETVVGMVLKLIGTNTSTVIQSAKARMEEINKIIPAGVKVVPYYDLATLVAKCVKTVTDALFQGVVLVALVLLVFMGGFRPRIVVVLSIPFSIFFAFILMCLFEISANLMSLGGLAIAIIIIVFLPLFSPQGVDGKTFNPLALTVVLAMGGSLIFALLFALVASDFLMRWPKAKGDAGEGLLVRILLASCHPLGGFFVYRRAFAVGLALLMFLGALSVCG